MQFRNAIKALFGNLGGKTGTAWKEIGTYNSIFSPYTADVYANETARACIRTLSEHRSKANVRTTDKRLEKLIQYRPNMYMNGKDWLYKISTLLEINNTCFIYINRDDRGACIGLYPVPHCPAEALDVGGKLYIRFQLADGNKMTAAWDDLAALRKDYNKSDIFGDDNTAIKTSLDLLNTTSQGMANAIKSTANLRGIVQLTKAQVKPEDLKRQKDQFVSDYLAMENTSGIAMTDSTMTFTPINIQPQIANYKSVEELRNNIYRYFGMNEDAVTSKLYGDGWEAFYEARIEPFLLALGLELSYKIYTDRQRGFGNEILFESNRMQYMSMTDKLALVQMVDRKAMTPNEWRAVLNLPPVPWGDEPLFWQDPKGEATKKKPEKPKETEADESDQQGQDVQGV